MTWKAPHRPSEEVSQTFNDGVVVICSVTDSALPGYQPVVQLEKKVLLHYEERRLGIQRYYSGMQNQVQVERVLRVQKAVPISNQDIAITESGHSYEIELVQAVSDVYPACLDLTLKRTTQKFEVPDEMA